MSNSKGLLTIEIQVETTIINTEQNEDSATITLANRFSKWQKFRIIGVHKGFALIAWLFGYGFRAYTGDNAIPEATDD